MAANDLKALARSLAQERDALVSRWIEALCRRSWALRTQSRGDTAQDALRAEQIEFLAERCRHFLGSLQTALDTAPSVEPGAPAYREAIQSLAFTAGWMAGAGLPATDAIGLVHGLQAVLGWPLEALFQALVVVVAEGYSASVVQRERARHRDVIERSQVVCEPHPRLPCLFLVGDPDRQAIDDAVGRLMMVAMMREAAAVVVDASALVQPERSLAPACGILTEHSRAAAVRVLVCGVPPSLAQELAARDPGVEHCETLSDAISRATALSGLVWPGRAVP